MRHHHSETLPSDNSENDEENEPCLNGYELSNIDSEKNYDIRFEHKLGQPIIIHNAADDLQKLSNGHSDLPATARTLFNSKPSVQTKFIPNMEHFFFGFKFQLKNYIEHASAAGITCFVKFTSV